MTGDLYTVLLVLVCQISRVVPNCAWGDAKWQGVPEVSLVSGQSNKLLVNWTSVVKNPSCVDQYDLWVWRHGTQKLEGKKYSIRAKKVTSKEVDVLPCVFYNIGVDILENDAFNKHNRPSGTVRFNSAILPNFTNPSELPHLKVGYYLNTRTKKFDLDQASIKIPTSFLTFSNCLKHIEVTASQSQARPPSVKKTESHGVQVFGLGRQPGGKGSSATMRWGHAGSGGSGSGFNSGGSGFNSGGSGSGFNSGGSGSGFNSGGSGSGFNSGGSGFNSGGSGSGFNSGGSGSGFNAGGSGSGFNSGTSSGGFSPPTSRPPAKGSWKYPDLSSPPGPGGQDFNPGKGGSGSTYNPGSSGSGGGFNPGARRMKTSFSQLLLRQTRRGSTKAAKSSVRKTGPWSGTNVEVLVPMDACKPQTFLVKFISTQNEELGSLKDVYLPELSDIADYIPPPFTEVLSLTLLGGQPKMEVQKSSSVPESCLGQYMEAVDAFANRLEDNLNHQVSESLSLRGKQDVEQDLVEMTQQEFLERKGCTCSSPRLELKIEGVGSNYETVQAKHKTPVFGVYLYEGIHSGHPYYQLDVEGRSPPVVSTRPNFPVRRKRSAFIGRVDGATTTTGRPAWNYGVHGGRSSQTHPGWIGQSVRPTAHPQKQGWRDIPIKVEGPYVRPSVRPPSHSWNKDVPIKVEIHEPKDHFLYWSDKSQQWLISGKLGDDDSKANFGSAAGSKTSCPADGKEVWQIRTPSLRSGKGRWQQESGIKLMCAPQYG